MSQYDLTINTGSNYIKTFTLKENGVAKNLTGFSATMYIVKNPGEMSTIVFSTTNGKIINGLTSGILTLTLTPADILTIDGEFYKLEIDDNTTQTEVLSGNLFLLTEEKAGVEYLIPVLRVYLGDTNPLTYRYLDEWLKVSLLASIKALQRWWKIRYTVDILTGVVSRYGNSLFTLEAPPVIMHQDEEPILLMACILIKSGTLQNNSWDVGTWRDAEIYVSNIEGGKLKDLSIKADWDRLRQYLKPPQNRLSPGARDSMLGANEY